MLSTPLFKKGSLLFIAALLFASSACIADEFNKQDDQLQAEDMLAAVTTEQSFIVEPETIRLIPEKARLDVPSVSIEMPKLTIELNLDLGMEPAF